MNDGATGVSMHLKRTTKNWQLPGRAFHHGRSDSTMDLLKGSLLCFKREQCQLPGMKNLLAKS